MLLRESSEHAGLETDLQVVRGRAEDPDGGVPHGALLRRFAEAVLADADDLAASRDALIGAVGPAPAAHAAGVIASFDAINRVADSTGIDLDVPSQARAGDLIESLGLEAMRSA